jgi:hypothetical protein
VIKPTVGELEKLASFATKPDQQKISVGINKNATLADYQDTCTKKGILGQVTIAIKGETSHIPSYPSHYRLIADCKMKPSSRLYYRVKDLRLGNVVIFLVRGYNSYLLELEIKSLRRVNSLYRTMIDDVRQLRSVNFSNLKLPRLNYAEQTEIPQERVDMATACAIHYGLHTGMVIRNIK